MAAPQTTDAPVLGRRERKKRETHARIVTAASELFAERGFEATTVEELAEAADISRATFFKYFAGKSAVASELGDRMTDTFVRTVESARTLDASTAERLVSIFEFSAGRLEERGELSREVVHETVARRRDRSEIGQQTARLHAAISALLNDGIERGDVREDVPLGLMAEIIVGSYVEILLTWVGDPEYALIARLREAVAFLESAYRPGSSPTPDAKTDVESNALSATRSMKNSKGPVDPSR